MNECSFHCWDAWQYTLACRWWAGKQHLHVVSFSQLALTLVKRSGNDWKTLAVDLLSVFFEQRNCNLKHCTRMIQYLFPFFWCHAIMSSCFAGLNPQMLTSFEPVLRVINVCKSYITSKRRVRFGSTSQRTAAPCYKELHISQPTCSNWFVQHPDQILHTYY